MPYLVSGHMRFTEDDSMKSDYYEKINKQLSNTRILLYNKLKKDYKQISNYIPIVDSNDMINNGNNEKKVLSNTLFSLLSLANTMGYTIDDLIKYKL